MTVAYSITSSAVTSNVGGTLRPSIRAVEALMTNSNFVDRSTSRFFRRLQILPPNQREK
jgi:hypothetical protein